MATATKAETGELKVNVELQGFAGMHKWPELTAYIYSRSGRLLAKSNVEQLPEKPGFSAIRFPGREQGDVKGVTLKIGLKVATIKEVTSQKLFTQRLDRVPLVENIPSVTLPQPVWIDWTTQPYLVSGSVGKRVDGQEYAVCMGEVDVYDVDVRSLLKLPDLVTERIRAGIIDLILDPPPFDLQQPEKIPGWWSVDEAEWNATPSRPKPPLIENLHEKAARLPPQWSFVDARLTALDTAHKRLEYRLQSMTYSEKQEWLNATLSDDLEFSRIFYSDTFQFRTLLVERFHVFRPWLCWFPWMHWLWWPWCRFYGLEKLATIPLESDGRFSGKVSLSICRKDHPDLWFRVRQAIDGVDREIHARYPMLCHTHWNHPDGKPVNLLTRDAQTVVCEASEHPDKRGVYVMPLGIGEDGWHEIEQAHLKSGDIPNGNRGLYKATDPYGTRLDLRMRFHESLKGVGVAYYRWSVAPEGSSQWRYLNAPVTHRHLTQIGPAVCIEPEQLGPFTVADRSSLFKLPDPDKDWIALDRNDRAFAFWYTALWDNERNCYVAQVPDGRYVLRLEMFDVAGNPLNPNASGAGWSYFLPTMDSVDGIRPVDNHLCVQADGSLHFNLWVDNTETTADLRSLDLGGRPVGDSQFFEYENDTTEQLRLSYAAYHKHPPERDFLASYTLSVKRGIAGTEVLNHSNTIPAQLPASMDTMVERLLRRVGGKGPFTRCALAVELHAYPRTRDGYSRVRQYQNRDRSAFALTKKPLPCLPLPLPSAFVEPVRGVKVVDGKPPPAARG